MPKVKLCDFVVFTLEIIAEDERANLPHRNKKHPEIQEAVDGTRRYYREKTLGPNSPNPLDDSRSAKDPAPHPTRCLVPDYQLTSNYECSEEIEPSGNTIIMADLTLPAERDLTQNAFYAGELDAPTTNSKEMLPSSLIRNGPSRPSGYGVDYLQASDSQACDGDDLHEAPTQIYVPLEDVLETHEQVSSTPEDLLRERDSPRYSEVDVVKATQEKEDTGLEEPIDKWDKRSTLLLPNDNRPTAEGDLIGDDNTSLSPTTNLDNTSTVHQAKNNVIIDSTEDMENSDEAIAATQLLTETDSTSASPILGPLRVATADDLVDSQHQQPHWLEPSPTRKSTSEIEATLLWSRKQATPRQSPDPEDPEPWSRQHTRSPSVAVTEAEDITTPLLTTEAPSDVTSGLDQMSMRTGRLGSISRVRSSSRSGFKPPMEKSPKHPADHDSDEEVPPKPSKLIKMESVGDIVPSGSSYQSQTQTRPTPLRTLGRRVTQDLELRKPSVAISGSKLDKKSINNIVIRLGGTIKDSVKDSTVLVFNGEARTPKQLCALVQGIPIVTELWLNESNIRGKFLPYDDYLWKDDDFDRKFNCNFAEACQRAKEHRSNGVQLLRGYEFLIFSRGTSTQANNEDRDHLITTDDALSLTNMVEACGGKVVKKEPKNPGSHVFIVGPTAYCKRSQSMIDRGFTVVKKEFILSLILKQDTELDFDSHLVSYPEQD
ncbi:hypothetical protein BGW38_010738 [Lunasporangiospora selenospora]|uniref:BRCT domain-containing protein n=1 Tax=Lunasporangiospora selenospora TaxID=979761 RepID=A0A9P6KIN2_9FUNG|nr:hypothetical protein BGW38_010738 [Lunasporangiospora selenospora]